MRRKICTYVWQALDQGGERLAGQGVNNEVWTHAIKSALCDAGHTLGYRVATGGVAQADEQEWLFDQVWMDWLAKPRQLKRIGLVVECEWGNQGDIFDDFEKLLVARADVRLMIFQAGNAEGVNTKFDLLEEEARDFFQSRIGDYYMFVGYDVQRSVFLKREFSIE